MVTKKHKNLGLSDPHPHYTTTATHKKVHRRQKKFMLARNILYLSWSHLKDISRFSPPQISKPGSYSPREVKYFLHRNNTMLCLDRDKMWFFLFLLPWCENQWQMNMNFISNVRVIGLSPISPVHRKETARHGWAENGLAEVLRPENKVFCRKAYAQSSASCFCAALFQIKYKIQLLISF